MDKSKKDKIVTTSPMTKKKSMPLLSKAFFLFVD